MWTPLTVRLGRSLGLWWLTEGFAKSDGGVMPMDSRKNVCRSSDSVRVSITFDALRNSCAISLKSP